MLPLGERKGNYVISGPKLFIRRYAWKAVVYANNVSL